MSQVMDPVILGLLALAVLVVLLALKVHQDLRVLRERQALLEAQAHREALDRRETQEVQAMRIKATETTLDTMIQAIQAKGVAAVKGKDITND